MSTLLLSSGPPSAEHRMSPSHLHSSGSSHTKNFSQDAQHEVKRRSPVGTLGHEKLTQDRQAKRYLGGDGKPRGMVRTIHGSLEHRAAEGDIWKPAVYHEELRANLIAEASLLGSYGELF